MKIENKKFAPDASKEKPLPTVADLERRLKVTRAIAYQAARKWKKNPPTESLKNILEA